MRRLALLWLLVIVGVGAARPAAGSAIKLSFSMVQFPYGYSGPTLPWYDSEGPRSWEQRDLPGELATQGGSFFLSSRYLFDAWEIPDAAQLQVIFTKPDAWQATLNLDFPLEGPGVIATGSPRHRFAGGFRGTGATSSLTLTRLVDDGAGSSRFEIARLEDVPDFPPGLAELALHPERFQVIADVVPGDDLGSFSRVNIRLYVASAPPIPTPEPTPFAILGIGLLAARRFRR